jgi:hypothetical protein
MNRPVQNVRPHATPVVAPVTRAIRFALAASAALALSTPALGIAADPCAQPALSAAAQACRADFRLAMVDANGMAPVDLTVVAGEPSPTSVIAFHGAHASTVDVTTFTDAGWNLDGAIAATDAGQVDDLTRVEGGTAFDRPFIAYTQHGDIGLAPALDNALDFTVEGNGNVIGLELHDPTALDFHNTGAITAIAHPDAYGAARATGVFAMSADVLVANDGDIGAFADADGGYARARAVETFAYGTGSTVENTGGIEAGASAADGTARAFGIYSFAYGSSSMVDNHGDVLATAQAAAGRAYATAINSIGYGGDASVDNTGALTAQAAGDQAYAFGITNLATRQSAAAQVTNAGTIDVLAEGAYATASGIVNAMFRYGGASVTSTGDIAATANGIAGASATGIYNYAYTADAIVANEGSLAAHATASAGPALTTGIYNHGGGYATTTSAGSIDASASTDAGFAGAWGLIGLAGDTAYVVNDGDIAVVAQSADGEALAAGIYARAGVLASVSNLGNVSAVAGTGTGDASAYGALVYAGFTGIGVLVNGGDLAATATVAGAGDAVAIGGYLIAEVATAFNDGSASASASTADGTADARALSVYGAYSAISNYGDVTATASTGNGDATAMGTSAFGYFGAATNNSNDIEAHATATAGLATAYGAYNLGVIFGAYTTNTGAIAATAQGEMAVAQGVVNAALYLGNAITVNDGSIVATAEGGIAPYGETEAIAFGVYNLAMIYDSIVENSGSIFAQAIATADLDDGFTQAKAIGAAAFNGYGYGDTGIVNRGDIGAISVTDRGYAVAWGAVVRSGGAYGGATTLDNAGTIHAEARSDIGISMTLGAYVASLMGDASVTNTGDITAYSRTERGIPGVFANTASATGVYTRAMYGATSLVNTGAIVGHAVGYGALAYAHGVQSYGDTIAIDNAAGASIVAIAEAERFGLGAATAIEAHGVYGVDITNAGDIYAHGSARGWAEGEYVFLGSAGAFGIYAESSFFGNVAVTNTGNVTAIAEASENVNGPSAAAGANGILAYGKYDATVVNAGDVFASATSDLGIAGAYGVQVHGKYSGNLVNEAGATIIAIAQVGSLPGEENAGRVIAFGTHTFGTDHGYTVNDGTVVAHAIATADDTSNEFPTMANAYGLSIGANSSGLDALIVNRGDVEARASADFGIATAYGTYVNTFHDSRTENSGSILATAIAGQGDALAVGAHVNSIHFDYYVPCTPYGCDYSNPIFTPDAGEASLANAGTVVAAAYAQDGTARSYGVGVFGGFGADVANTGDITAIAEAEHATATGVFVAAPYDSVDVVNAGTVLAAAYGPDATAIGLRMESGGVNTLVNAGTIAALGDGGRIAVSSSADAAASLVNHGTLVGAIVTGNLADTLANGAGALWHAVGDSDFGAGADVVTNAGTIVLDDAAVRLGAAGDGDAFANTGLIRVSGSGNTIELPGGTFANDGVISFLDGVADDRLSVLGDFAGDGAILLDVSGLTQASDRLYVGGSVTGSQVLDVNLLTAPTAASTLIPLVFVDGDATADSFALGNVAYATNGFLALDFNLDANIDATNASADVFSLGMTVTGLNGAGALASVLAPGVQGVVNAQVGSWRQRMGVASGKRDGVLEPWLRLFSDSGDIAPTHSGNFGPGGDFGFHQSNRGWELGLDTRPSGNLALGMLIASSEGSQQLDSGAGRADLDARTVGIYGTWTADSFYLDVSQRWIGIDARLESTAGLQRTEANASAFSVEAGYTAWTVGSLHVVPQVQYTHSRVGDIEDLQGGASTFADDGGLSSRVRLGVAFDRTFEAAGYAWTPFGTLNAVHELDGDYDHAINDGLHGTTSIDGTSMQVELGLEARKGRFSVTGSVNRTDGGALDGITGGQMTVRYRW